MWRRYILLVVICIWAECVRGFHFVSSSNQQGSRLGSSRGGSSWSPKSSSSPKQTSAYSPRPQQPKDKWKRIEKGDRDVQAWQSGAVFVPRETRRNTRRSDPWWMLDEELKNPRTLPEYQPWWVRSNSPVDMTWKVAALREEAERRGLNHTGVLKKDLVEKLNDLHKKFSLSDDNFTAVTLLPTPPNTNPCYPEIYEKNTAPTPPASPENTA